MTGSLNLVERSNMLLLSKTLNEKDRNLKPQLLLTTKNKEKTPSEGVWQENGFFKNIRSKFNIHKTDFLENTFTYINQVQLSVSKKELIIHNDCFILGQISPLQNPQQDLDNYVCKVNELKMLVPLYNSAYYIKRQ